MEGISEDKYKFVYNNETFNSVDTSNIEYLFGTSKQPSSTVWYDWFYFIILFEEKLKSGRFLLT